MSPTAEEIAAAQAEADAAANGDSDDSNDEDDEDVQEGDADRLRAQLQAARKAERAIKKERDQLKRGQLSEAERIQQERDEAAAERDQLRRQLRERDARTLVETEARKANAIRPDVIFKLLDLEYDDDGQPINLRTELAKAKKDYPEMFGAAGSADGGSGRGAAPQGGSFTDQLRRQMGRG